MLTNLFIAQPFLAIKDHTFFVCIDLTTLRIVATGNQYGQILPKCINHFRYLEDSAEDTEQCPNSKFLLGLKCKSLIHGT